MIPPPACTEKRVDFWRYEWHSNPIKDDQRLPGRGTDSKRRWPWIKSNKGIYFSYTHYGYTWRKSG